MTYAIETRALTRRYGKVNALDNVSIQIAENTITGLLGRNGAGKTTLMALITAQDRATAGEVLASGKSPFENAAALEGMCFIRDNQRYPDDYSLKHVLRAARAFFPNWDQALADELVALFLIPGKQAVKKLSRGQFSAVGIVVGLASRAPITFFDEPYLGLDATARGHFYDVLMRDYLAHPRTIVLSTHLIDEMDQLLERVIILDRGRVIHDAEVDELRGAAYRVSGLNTAVQAHAEGRTVLSRHIIGGLGSLVIEGQLSAQDRATAEAAGIEVGQVTLQELVAAYGFDGSATPLTSSTEQTPTDPAPTAA